MGISAFPKIFTIGQTYISDIFKSDVEITEKVDGSQFVFGKVNGELFIRSKGAVIYIAEPVKMFAIAVNYVLLIENIIPDNHVFYCEYLNKPKHNVLEYGNIPLNNLCLFAMSDHTGTKFEPYSSLTEYATRLNIDVVPLIYTGLIHNIDDLKELLERDSYLGGVKIEGFVAKNYSQPFMLGGVVMPLMSGKYVSEKFKEKHNSSWSKDHTARGKWQTFLEQFKTEARWEKAVQHLRDSGNLEQSPRDIGTLIKEVKEDVAGEYKQEIVDFLWNNFKREILGYSVRGLPEWYKEKLAANSFVE